MKTHDAHGLEQSLQATKVKTTNPKEDKVTRSGRWFRRSRRWHDPMLVLNMSIFNSGSSWNRIVNPIPLRENVWC